MWLWLVSSEAASDGVQPRPRDCGVVLERGKRGKEHLSTDPLKGASSTLVVGAVVSLQVLPAAPPERLGRQARGGSSLMGLSRCRLPAPAPVSQYLLADVHSRPLQLAQLSLSCHRAQHCLPSSARRPSTARAVPRLHQPAPTRRLAGLQVLHVLLTACEARQASQKLPHPCAS